MLARQFCAIANPQSYAIRDDGFKAHFGARYQLLSETPGFAAAQKYASYADVPDDMRQYFPQDHPFWLQFRSLPQLTGSRCAELLGLHDSQAANMLGLPRCMFVHDGNNRAWDDYLDRARFPGLPSTGLDPPGNFNAAGGKFKESGAAGTLLEYVPGMVFREVGAIVVTPAHLAQFNIVNVLTGKRIETLPFKMVVSPDMDATIPLFVSDDPEDQPHIETIDVAGEIKTPTYFGVKDKSPFYGLDFYPRGRGCAPYDHPKEYYLQQTFLEMVALGRRHCLFFSYTLGQGAVAWLIDMDDEYLSLMFTILLYLHTTFIVCAHGVPTNYFFNMREDAPVRAVYVRLLEMTKKLCTAAPVYMRITATQCAEFGERMGYLSKDTYLQFPRVPPGVLHSYQRLQMYAYRLFRDWHRFTWVRRFDQLDARRANIAAVLDTPLTAFAAAALQPVLSGDQITGRYAPAAREMPSVVARVLETAENYLADVLCVIHEFYGSPPFGEPLSPALFAANIYSAAGRMRPAANDDIGCSDDYWRSMASAEPAEGGETLRMWKCARVIHDAVALRRAADENRRR